MISNKNLVNFPLLRNKKNLFIENERVVVECRDKNKRTFVIVLVGALNVGRMVLLFEDKIKTNSDIREAQHYKYKDLWFDKGGWWRRGNCYWHTKRVG